MRKDKSSKEDYYKKREALKDLCASLKAAQKLGAYSDCNTMNEILKEFYAEAGHTVLKTFNEWKKDGYSIVKGAKAILLWGTPKATKESKQAAAEAGKTEEEAKEDYFPLAYMFSNKQVHKIN